MAWTAAKFLFLISQPRAGKWSMVEAAAKFLPAQPPATRSVSQRVTTAHAGPTLSTNDLTTKPAPAPSTSHFTTSVATRERGITGNDAQSTVWPARIFCLRDIRSELSTQRPEENLWKLRHS